MEVKVFVNSVFNSNTYLLFKVDKDSVWIIDPGSNFEQVEAWLKEKNKTIKGIMLTHTHFDHILGLNALMKSHPQVEVFASVFAAQGLKSEKLNGSLYMEIPFVVENVDIVIVKQDDTIELWEGLNATVFETPGHDRDCVSYFIVDYLFSGDALIPGIKVHTKLKYSNKEKAKESIDGIRTNFNQKTIIYPGHGNACRLSEIDFAELL